MFKIALSRSSRSLRVDSQHNPETSQLRALLFDLDGTLYRHGPVRRSVMAAITATCCWRPLYAIRVVRVLRSYRSALEALRTHAIECNLSAAQIHYAATECGESEQFVAGCVTRWMEEKPLRSLRAAMWSGVVELLEEARSRGLRLAVCSDYPAEPKLRAMGIHSYFDAVFCSRDPAIQRLKPDPRIIHHALEKLQVESAGALFLGDRADVDGAAAAAAGVRFKLVDSPLVFHSLVAEVRAMPLVQPAWRHLRNC